MFFQIIEWYVAVCWFSLEAAGLVCLLGWSWCFVIYWSWHRLAYISAVSGEFHISTGFSIFLCV